MQGVLLRGEQRFPKVIRLWHESLPSRSALTPTRVSMRMSRHLTEPSTDLGIDLPQSSLFLGSFIGVLWVLSGKRGISRYSDTHQQFGGSDASATRAHEVQTPKGLKHQTADPHRDCELPHSPHLFPSIVGEAMHENCLEFSKDLEP